jgi:adenylyl cyclase-associated protein
MQPFLTCISEQGVPVAQYKPISAVTGPPPPPPPPPPHVTAPASGKTPAGGSAAVFAELNKGEAVTQGLRKVDKSEMTHKNPSLRAGSAVPDRSTSPTRKPIFLITYTDSNPYLSQATKKPLRPSKPQSLMGKKPSKFALEGSKWAIVSIFRSTGRITCSLRDHRNTKRTSRPS